MNCSNFPSLLSVSPFLSSFLSILVPCFEMHTKSMALHNAMLQNLIIKLKTWHKTVKDDSQTQIFATKQMKIYHNINPEWNITGARECFLCKNLVKHMPQQCAGVV